ncbi:MAG: sigma-54-dependent Fis family transcriptional regulator, partial [Myxococcales bacterium]|nr:sigma-54-dependent Fis family transcriptional regulator [Myxococcales bacterium]
MANHTIRSGPGPGTFVEDGPAGDPWYGARAMMARDENVTATTVRVLVVDDEKNYLLALDALLSESGYTVVTTSNPLEAQKLVEDETFDCLISDLKMPRMSGLDLLRVVKQADPSLPVLMLTAHGTVETAVEAMREGAYHYLLKPFENEELKLSVAKAVELGRLRREKDYLRESIRDMAGFGDFVGRGESMRKVFELIEQVAPARTTVLVLGESGTGKELAARAIHQKSARADRPFVAVNCCALAETLLESELF